MMNKERSGCYRMALCQVPLFRMPGQRPAIRKMRRTQTHSKSHAAYVHTESTRHMQKALQHFLLLRNSHFLLSLKALTFFYY